MATEIALRPRTAAEIVDVGFALARRHYLPMVTAAAVGALAVMPVHLLRASSFGAVPGTTAATVVGWSLNLYGLAVLFLARGAAVAIATEAYLGRRLDPAAALALAGRRAWPLLGAGACYLAMLWGGLILLVVPALGAMARFGALPAVIMAEDGLGPIAALRRTAALSDGRRWRVLATVGVAYVVVMLLGIGTQYGVLDLGATGRVARLVTLAVNTTLSPFYGAVIAALYVDLRVVHEAFDIETLAAAMDAAAPAASVDATAGVTG